MIYDCADYRGFLRQTLAQKISQNPAFSLRSFAKVLDISPAYLSQIQTGKRNLSASTALRIAKKLKLTRRETDYFCSLVNYAHAKDARTKTAVLEHINASRSNREIKDLSTDAFLAISQWYHLPILQMLRLKDFNFSTYNIARRLGITQLEAEEALVRMQRLGLIRVNESGKFEREQADIMIRSADQSDALRTFHQQMLQKAMESITSQNTKERYIGSETISIDVQLLPQAKAMIDEFLNQIVRFLGQGQTPTETYHVGVQMFRLTKQEQR